MPKMTFTEDFRKDLDARTSVYWPAGGTFDVPDDLVAEVTAAGAAAPATADHPTPAEPHGIS